MNSEIWLSIIPIALGIGGAIWGAGGVVARQLREIERRFDKLEKRVIELEHSSKSGRAAIQSHLDMLNYKLDTNFEYRINANTELIEHRSRRFESAIKALSAALEKYSDGRYTPRGPSQWPTDNAPPESRR